MTRDPESPLAAATARLEALAAGARREGRRELLEPEAQGVVEALGLSIPRSVFVSSSAAVVDVDLERLRGETLVLKAVVEGLLHKSEVGAVTRVPRSTEAARQAIAAMEGRLAGPGLRGFILAEWIDFDRSPGGELLVGMRWTEDFGPVVTIAPGGLHADLLGRHLLPESGAAVLSPALGLDLSSRRRLRRKAIVELSAEAQRGNPPRIARDRLEEVLTLLLQAGEQWIPDLVEELEVNPLALTADGPVALDAVIRLGSGSRDPRPARPLEKLARLLRPASIAVVGVSRRPNPGRIIVENLLATGFPPDRVVIVKAGVDELLGCRCVPDLASLPQPVDLLVLAVAASQAGPRIEEIIAGRLAESVILIPGGLGERRGSEDRAEELRRLIDDSRSTDWRGPIVNGGNCLGVRSLPGRFNTLFLPRHKLPFPATEPAPLAVLSQSGAFAATVASRLADLNPRYVISYGNQLDLTVADYLEYLEGDPELRIIACYVEGFQRLDGRRWLRAASRLSAAGRSVLLYRAGRSSEGARASATHTASIAGDYLVARELARAAGVLVADSLADFHDLVKLCCRLEGRAVAGRRLATISNAGFECVAMADAVDGFELPAFAAATEARLQQVLREARIDQVVGVGNPLDLTPIVDDALFEAAVRAVLEDPTIDLGVVGCVPLTGALQTLEPAADHREDLGSSEALAPRLTRLWDATSKAWVAVVDAGPLYDPLARRLEAAAIPTLRSADRAVRLLQIYCDHRLTRDRLATT